MSQTRYLISREDWSLHRQGQMDQERHQERIREALKANLPGIVSDESIITSDGKKLIRVPIRTLQEYRFKLDWQKQNQVGQGEGGSQKGQPVGGGQGGQPGPGQGGSQAGEAPGEEWFEVAVSVEELEELLFEQLSLPHLDPKRQPDLSAREYQWRDVHRQGLQSNIDKKRTLMEAIKRNRLAGRPPLAGLSRADLRYKTWEEEFRPQASAVLIAMMDTSGSMGEAEKYLARSMYFWMVRFLRTKYDNVRIHFLAHSTEAREVTEEEFFTRGESGGTRCSSVYDLALRLIAENYPPELYNLYAFHFSDGDNLLSDNPKTVALVRQLLEHCNLVGYGEIEVQPQYLGMPYYQASTLMSLFQQQIDHPRFVKTTIREKADVPAALRTFFPPDTAGAEKGVS